MTDPDELWRGGSTERQACIPAPLRDLHRAILRQFLQTGTPPTASWITGTAAGLDLDATAMADLETADLVRTADGMVTVAPHDPTRGSRRPQVPDLQLPCRVLITVDNRPAVKSS